MMICFPLDNTEYEALALGAWFGTRTRGVFAADDNYSVMSNGNMTVTLTSGYGWLKADRYWGVVIYEPEPTTLVIETAHGSLTRLAAICLQLDKNLNLAQPVVKYGPLGVNPALNTLPLPVRNIDYDEIYVAAVRVRAGATEILPSDIIELRLNETYCGIMRDGVTGIPTQALEEQWRFWADKEQADFETWARLTRTDFSEWAQTEREDFEAWELATKSSFEQWVLTIKDLLDEEVAGNLILLIESIRPILGSADPIETTIGAVSQMYVNIDTRSLFVCTDTSDGVYTWLAIIGGSAATGAAVLGASHLGAAYLM